MIVKLFDTNKIVNHGGINNYSESLFQYALKNNSKQHQIIKRKIGGWYKQFMLYNPQHAKDLLKRFQSIDDEHHLSALTELYIHNLLLENNYIPKVHPDMSGVKNKPDFVALYDDEPMFIIEVAVVYDNKVVSRRNK